MYTNPKSVKQHIKLFFFHLVDLAIVVISFMAISSVLGALPLPGWGQALNYILAATVSVFLALRSPRHPVDRNIAMLFHLYKMDRRKYYDYDADDQKFIL